MPQQIITWEDATHELRPVIAHGVRQEDDLVTEWLLAECLVRDRARGGPVLLWPARGCPGHEVTLEVGLTLVKAHNLSIREGPVLIIWEGKKLINNIKPKKSGSRISLIIQPNLNPPLKHIKLWYFPREALELVKSSPESVLFLAQDKQAITIQDRVKNRGELLREPQCSFCCIEKLYLDTKNIKLLHTLRPDLNLCVDRVFI